LSQNSGLVPNQWPSRSAVSACDCALTVNDASDAIHWDIDLPRQFGGGNSYFLQLFGKMLAGMYRGACHGVS
jgi:hypothetical protein